MRALEILFVIVLNRCMILYIQHFLNDEENFKNLDL